MSEPIEKRLLDGGVAVVIRTVTMHYLGRVRSYGDEWIELTEASWLADTQIRWAEFLRSGPSDDSEIEPYPDGVLIPRGAVVDVSPWAHELPTEASP